MRTKKCLKYDISRRMYMSDVSRQPYPKGRTAQFSPHPSAAVSALARGRPATGPKLLHLRAPGLSLPRAGTATQAPSSGRRCQSILHRQAFAPSGTATPRLRRFDRIDLKRDRQPCLPGGPAPRGRSWLSRRPVSHGIPLRPIIAGQVGPGLRTTRVGPVLVDCSKPAARELPGGCE